MKTSYEVERKFKVKKPSDEELFYIKTKAAVKEWSIIQTYLTTGTVTDRTERRVRKLTNHVQTPLYFYTEKTSVSALVREEKEKEISEKEYAELIKDADKTLQPIEKTRYIFKYKECTFALDVYPFSNEFAILEVQLPYEESAFYFPTFLQIYGEITENPAYKNYNLAKSQAFPD